MYGAMPTVGPITQLGPTIVPGASVPVASGPTVLTGATPEPTPPAVRARRRKDAKRDEKRKIGGAVLRATGATPPPPQAQPPQPTAPQLGPVQAGVLQAIGAPATPQNLQFLGAWTHAEGTKAENNPLATTQPEPGATEFNWNNGYPVENYPSPQVGVRAIASTLTNGRYPTLVAALRSGNPYAPQFRAGLQSEIATWGSPAFLGGSAGGGGGSAPGGAPQTTTSAGGSGAALLPVPPLGKPPPPPTPISEQAAPPPQVYGVGSNSTYDPAPTEANPQFRPAQYEPPKKGLEYLALGLGLLFPGAPIGRLAAGFAGGLNQGAQQRYERDEQAAEQQYQAAENTAKVDYQNAQARQAQAQAMRAQGIDPMTGRPFVLPAPLAAPLPRNAPATAYVQRDQAMAAWYLSVGATGPASEALERAKANQTIAEKNAEIANGLRSAIYREASENYRNDKTIAARAATTNADNLTRAAISQASNATRASISQADRADRDVNDALNRLATRSNQDAREADEDRRMVTGIALKHAFEVRNNPQAQTRAAENAAKLRAEQQVAYAKATQGGTVINPASGRAQQIPATITGDAKAKLDMALAKINSEVQDPVGLAMRLSDGQPEEVTQILMTAGKARQALLESQGQPVWIHPAGDAPSPAPSPAPSADPTASATGPQFPNPPHLPQGAQYIGRGPTGGDEYAFPDGTHGEYKP